MNKVIYIDEVEDTKYKFNVLMYFIVDSIMIIHLLTWVSINMIPYYNLLIIISFY